MSIYRNMWSKSTLLIAIFALFGFLTLCSGLSYHITKVRRNGNVYYLYKGRHYRTFSEVMAQIRKESDEFNKRLTRKPPVMGKTKTPRKKPLPRKRTPRPNKPVRPSSKRTRRPQPPKPNPRPSSRTSPKTVKPRTKSTTKSVVRRKPPKSRIDPKYIPSAAEVDKLYTFDVNVEKKKKSSGPFSERVYDQVWRGYNYKSDYKKGYLDMRNRILKETNRYRQAHGVKPLTYDYNLEKASQEYAKYLGDRDLFDHDPKNDQNGWGENLAKMSASLGSLATKNWYDEVKLYDFSKNQFSYDTGHFTALVWKETTKVGCGIYMKREILYVVCKYFPAGNMLNEFHKNQNETHRFENGYKKLYNFFDVSIYCKMWSKSSFFIAIFALFGFLTLCSGFSYQIKQVIRNGESYFIYNNKRYGTFQEAMDQVNKDMTEYFNKMTGGSSVIWITRTPKIQPLPVMTTPRPNKPVWPALKTTRPSRPRPSSRIPPKTVKPGTKSTTKSVVTQKPPKSRIDPKYIPSAAEVDKLYTFDVNQEKKKKSSGPFSERVYDEVWNGYNYKNDYKTGYLDMRDRILKETNRYRQAHGVPALTYDYNLEKASQEYAKYLGDYNLFEHDPKNRPKGWGENLAKMSASLGSLATKKWYDEVSMYDFAKNKYVPGTGHFTALVWKETKKVGCGIYMKREILYVVCKYSPAGNMLNEFHKNVFKRLPQYN
uniref:SCP domain-containing protein n=2 Tax=Strongyloides stercoralis TaxID=6248 RepID=A0AAF5D5R5_STRER